MSHKMTVKDHTEKMSFKVLPHSRHSQTASQVMKYMDKCLILYGPCNLW